MGPPKYYTPARGLRLTAICWPEQEVERGPPMKENMSWDWGLAQAEEQIWWERERIGWAEYTIDFKMIDKLRNFGSGSRRSGLLTMTRSAVHWQ